MFCYVAQTVAPFFQSATYSYLGNADPHLGCVIHVGGDKRSEEIKRFPKTMKVGKKFKTVRSYVKRVRERQSTITYYSHCLEHLIQIMDTTVGAIRTLLLFHRHQRRRSNRLLKREEPVLHHTFNLLISFQLCAYFVKRIAKKLNRNGFTWGSVRHLKQK